MQNDYRIRIGAMGWEHSQWLDSFYPEDLPEDWRLAFYGNEFPVVGIPQAAWSDDIKAQIEEWLDNSEEHFRFVCEWRWEGGASMQALAERLSTLSEFALGVLLQVPVSQCTVDSNLSDFLSEGFAWPVCLELFDEEMRSPWLQALDFTDAALSEFLHRFELGCCWHGQEGDGVPRLQQGCLAVARVDSAGLQGRALRAIVETCSDSVHEGGDTVLLFEGQPPDIQVMRDASVILDLLG